MPSDPLQESIIDIRSVERPLQGVEVWRNLSNGFKVIDLSHDADPRKRSDAWRQATQSGMGRAEWNREYGKKWIVYDGKAVYADFDPEIHIVRGTIFAKRRAKLVSGWDGGPDDLYLAWVLGIVDREENAIIFVDEYQVSDGDTNDFVDTVHSRLSLEWFKLGGFSLHIADQSVFTGSGVAGNARIARKSMSDIMRKHGMSPIPGEISFAKRRNCVIDLLTRARKSVDGQQRRRLMIHERCEKLIEAYSGGYHYPKVAGGIGGGFREKPTKNESSHVANASEYAASRMGLATMDIPYEGQRLPAVRVV